MGDDDAFNLDDVMEIFGGDVSLPAKEEVSTATKTPAASPAAPEEDDTKLTAEELEILAQYEQKKKEVLKEEEEAKQKKEEEARKILEAFEKEKKEKAEREAEERRRLAEKQKAELEALQQQNERIVDDNTKQQEEARIIAEFEREMAAKKEQEEQAAQHAEAKAQQELKALQEKEAAEKKRREEEEQKLKDSLASKVDSKKADRLQELMAKAQKDIGDQALAPLKSFDRPPVEGVGGDAAEESGFISRPDDIGSKENEELLTMFDEVRKACFTFLAPTIGIRATNNMLTKTVEKARKAYPSILKDVNWRADGDIRDDGSIDGPRFFKNFGAMPAHEAVDNYLNSLGEICKLRLKSVEMGLGESVAADLKKTLAKLKKQFINDGLGETNAKVFFAHILKET